MVTEAVGPVLFKRFSVNAAAATQVIAAVDGKKIRILGLVAGNNAAGADVVMTLQDDTGTPVVICGPILLPQGEQLVLPTNGIGYGETSVGKDLDILLDGTEVVAGSITYQLVG